MPSKKYVLAFCLVALVIASFLMAYFVRPQAPSMEMVTASQELNVADQRLPNDLGLSARVSKSYGLALVLTISELSQRDATAAALESLRSWAHENFQRDPGFLHPPMPEGHAESHESVVDALFFNLCAAPWYAMEDQTVAFLKARIAAFHETPYYQHFRATYFDCFGKDKESALLLARYQSDRAAQAVNVLLSALFWLVAGISGVVAFIVAPQGTKSTKGQRLLAHFWLALAIYYLILAWVQNNVPVLVSALFSGFVGLYLRRPIVVTYGVDKGLTLRLVSLSNKALAISYWLSFSLVAIQILTWIKTGTLNDPDPITLLMSALKGNFVHDPINGKHTISHLIGALWLLSGLWVVWEYSVRKRSSPDVEEGLAMLKDSFQ